MVTQPTEGARRGGRITIHPLIVRATHWVNAFAMVCMIMSGWKIYDASPLFPFSFPAWATLGGWLGGAIAWHLAAMWLLVANGLLYVAYGLAGGHFRRSFLPLSPAVVWADLRAALTFKLVHRLGHYNAVQRLLYVAVLLAGVLAVSSGLALWKPVQLHPLSLLFGGYEVTRRVHFIAMAGIVGFVVVHLALVLLVPRTLPPMITGRAKDEHR
ncbi:MAG TPA: cytochrome b/b6 domain-containing protein [Aliidongia sp.]|uniref:cytochrome b/b6 domain-containing protein n=1 Tax=Aliidongia sp. TaxID=1914230 RepID=UPI002DDD147E|nr:cytochrome b/b6 domain-containing protein [Aliidongia sp.]HEV2677038.1 cytochrome b/b6 domain-containing protein [Aliidongia sp.]